MNPAEEIIVNARKITSNSTNAAMPNGDSRKSAISMSLRTFFPVEATSLLNNQAISGVNASTDTAATIRSKPSKGRKVARISPAAWRIAVLVLVLSITRYHSRLIGTPGVGTGQVFYLNLTDSGVKTE